MEAETLARMKRMRTKLRDRIDLGNGNEARSEAVSSGSLFCFIGIAKDFFPNDPFRRLIQLLM